MKSFRNLVLLVLILLCTGVHLNTALHSQILTRTCATDANRKTAICCCAPNQCHCSGHHHSRDTAQHTLVQNKLITYLSEQTCAPDQPHLDISLEVIPILNLSPTPIVFLPLTFSVIDTDVVSVKRRENKPLYPPPRIS